MRRTFTTLAVAGDGLSSLRNSMARAEVTSSIARMRDKFSTTLRNLRAALHPIETWSSCMAELGIESTLAGVARRLFSLTNPACVYWAIIKPESTPGSCAKNGGRPDDRF
ncbi:unannotated protein [freshwater metagenome]|uniref:Unannotated protein n=1 Tax=freshwater metagenome TaxID=449393 RepID=A0A6J6W0T4_9ZZZZ